MPRQSSPINRNARNVGSHDHQLCTLKRIFSNRRRRLAHKVDQLIVGAHGIIGEHRRAFKRNLFQSLSTQKVCAYILHTRRNCHFRRRNNFRVERILFQSFQAFWKRYRRNVLYKRFALAFKHSHSKLLHGIGLSSNLHRLRNIERAVELAHHVVADCTVGIVIITYAVYIRMVCAFYKHLRLIPPGSVIGIGASFWHVHCGAARICLVLYAGDFRQRGRNGRRQRNLHILIRRVIVNEINNIVRNRACDIITAASGYRWRAFDCQLLYSSRLNRDHLLHRCRKCQFADARHLCKFRFYRLHRAGDYERRQFALPGKCVCLDFKQTLRKNYRRVVEPATPQAIDGERSIAERRDAVGLIVVGVYNCHRHHYIHLCGTHHFAVYRIVILRHFDGFRLRVGDVVTQLINNKVGRLYACRNGKHCCQQTNFNSDFSHKIWFVFCSQKSAFSNLLQKIKAAKMFPSRNPMFP